MIFTELIELKSVTKNHQFLCNISYTIDLVIFADVHEFTAFQKVCLCEIYE